MKWLIAPALALVLFSAALATDRSFAADGGPLPDPEWKNSVIAHIWLNHSDTNLDIRGTDLLDLHYRPLEEARRAGMADEKSKKAFEGALQEALAFLTLTRVLDQEINRYMTPILSENRINYAFREILVENAVNCEKVPTTTREVPDHTKKGVTHTIKVAGTELGIYSNDQLYKWLRECFQDVAEQAKKAKQPFYGVNYEVDWNYLEGGLAELRQAMEPVAPSYGPPWWRKEVQVPNLSVPVDQLPETWREFKALVEKELNASFHLFARGLVWRTMVADRFPTSLWTAAYVVEQGEMKKRLATLRALSEFIPGEELHATIADLTLTGSAAEAAREKLRHWIDEKVADVTKKIADETKNASPDSRSPRELLRMTRINGIMRDARKNASQELLEKLKSEFAAELSSGALVAALNEHAVNYNGSDPLPKENTVPARELKMAASPLLKWVVYPYFDVKSDDGSVQFKLLKDLRGNDLKDPKLFDAIREQIASKQLTAQSRTLAKFVFDENRFWVVKDTCTDPAWPCVEIDSKTWADKLLGEVLYPADMDVSGPVSMEWSGKLSLVMKFQPIQLREASFLLY